MTDRPGAPGAQPEPRWPLYVERSDGWDLYDQRPNGCACRMLEVIWQESSLFGALCGALGRCMECGRRWEWVSPLQGDGSPQMPPRSGS